jgi:hypothetical protein
MRTLIAALLTTGLMTGVALAETVNFDRTEVGKLPPNWTATMTGKGEPQWAVVADDTAPSKPNVLKQSGVATYPLCIKEDTNLKDGYVEVKLKPVSGKEDQAGGVIWRCKDADNYYIARPNATENNVVLYKTVAGKRSSLDIVGRKGGYGVKEPVAAGQWHTLRVEFTGNLFTVIFNGKKLFDVQDDTFTEAGKVGLWTKADSVTLFDDFGYGPGERTWSFGRAQAGSLPRGWRAAETNGKGNLAKWEVVKDDSAPTPPNALALTQTQNTRSTFNLLVADGTSYQNLELAVKVKALSGKEDQGGGPIWRAQDEKNYYTARWNPLETNLRVYYVKDSKRVQIANVDITVDPKAWHEIEIRHVGAKITAGLDGKTLIEVEDRTFPGAGKIGLWTKADAATAFDDIKVKQVVATAADSETKAKNATAAAADDDDDKGEGKEK